MSVGMQLSVVCAEDYPRIKPDDACASRRAAYSREHLLRSQMRACEFWPKGRVPASYYEPVTSAVPALVLSGDLDPVTPPSWGETVATHLSEFAAHHRAGHGAWHRGDRVRRTACPGLCRTRHASTASTPVVWRVCSARRFFSRRPDPTRRATRGRVAMIRVENLHKRFGAVTAVDGVSFTAQDGAVTGLLGPNGAGKTTTLRMLYALMRPDEGSIMVDDVDAVAQPQQAQARLGVLPDVSGLYPRLTPREHIEYYGQLHGSVWPGCSRCACSADANARHGRDRGSADARLLAWRADQGGARARAGP